MLNVKKSIPSLILLIFFTSISLSASANKTSVKISAVKGAAKGTEVTVTINVTHNANSFSHYTDWVYLKINGKEVKRWTYSKSNLPEGAAFTLTYKFILTEAVSIEAMGDCNLHGSAGAVTAKIKVL